MSNQKETVQEKLARMQREAAAKGGSGDNTDLISQLTHEGAGEPDYDAIARALEEKKAKEPEGANAGHVKMTLYVREDLARGFDALCTKHGDKKAFINQAIADFIQKKARELGINS